MAFFYSLLIIFGLFLGSASAQTQGNDQAADHGLSDFDSRVRDFLLRNPEVVQEALGILESKKQKQIKESRTSALTSNQSILYHSKRHASIGNQNGTFAFVEFFDYNCGFCKKSLRDKLSLLESDPSLILHLKEFPILGANSVEAARVSIALKQQDNDGKLFFEFHRKLLSQVGPVNGARALDIAREVGCDMDRLSRDIDSQEVTDTLDENRKLATALSIRGTPAYVIGSEVIPGAVGIVALRDLVAKGRL